MKRMSIALFALATIGAAPPAATHKPATLAYLIPGQDPLSIKFRKALDARIARDKDLRRVKSPVGADLTIESPARSIDWDTLNGRLVVIYILQVKSRTRSFRLSGVCYANDMDKCARDLLSRSKHYALRR